MKTQRPATSSVAAGAGQPGQRRSSRAAGEHDAPGPRSSSAVVVANLHKGFGPNPVLRGLYLEVPAGSFTTVLGPSGSGKTTLLRVLAGLERPDSGTVTIGGQVVDDEHTHVAVERRRIGYVSQEGSLFPHLSVEANVGFGLRRRERRQVVGDLLDAVGLAGLARRYPHQLSGGQQQRVALARALAIEPQVVLLDEPFASLDASLRASVRSDVRTVLRCAGTTTVMVTHDQDEALSISDQVAVVRDGRTAQLGPPEDIYARPVDGELARFVGEANLVEGLFDGRYVTTALGKLAVAPECYAVAPGKVTVLVRPEQVDIWAGTEQLDIREWPGEGPRPGGGGVPAQVLSTAFYGHDAVLRLAPGPCCPLPEMIARVLGEAPLEVGSAVLLGARGPVTIWPPQG
jgi:iron(III) transport system ATP-binding protein